MVVLSALPHLRHMSVHVLSLNHEYVITMVLRRGVHILHVLEAINDPLVEVLIHARYPTVCICSHSVYLKRPAGYARGTRYIRLEHLHEVFVSDMGPLVIAGVHCGVYHIGPHRFNFDHKKYRSLVLRSGVSPITAASCTHGIDVVQPSQMPYWIMYCNGYDQRYGYIVLYRSSVSYPP